MNNTDKAGLWQIFTVEKVGTITTTAAVPQTTANYTMANMVSADLNVSSLRTGQLKRIRVRFNPTGIQTTQQFIEVQLFYVTVDAQVVAMTKAVPLSMTNPTYLTFTLANNIAEQRTVNDSNSLWGITFFNRASAAALSVPLYYDISADFRLSADSNSSI